MKKYNLLGSALIMTLFGMCLVFFGCSRRTELSKGDPVRYVVGVSPFLEKSDRNLVFRHLIRFLLEDMPLNSSLWIYDAYQLKTIARFDIPNVRAFESDRTRANQFSDPIKSLKTFLASDSALPEVEDLDFTSAIKLPQFMDFIGSNPASEAQPLMVILLGSPCYMDEKEPGYSMRKGYFPSDGHLSATHTESVYGIKDNPIPLEDLHVHMGYFGDPWENDLHRQKVGRFWNCYLNQRGAVLESFTGDLPTLFNSIQRPNPNPGSLFCTDPDSTSSKIEMIRISREIGATDWLTGELPDGHNPPPPAEHQGPMKIGIRWGDNLDLDLYSRADSEASTLFFQQMKNDLGYYYKDHRSSPDRDYEFIEYFKPVDVWTTEARVNFYEGEKPGGAVGEVRIEFQGRIYSSQFTIPTSHGNQGRGGPQQSGFWTVLDIPKIMGLR